MFSQAENNYPSIFHSLAQPQTAFMEQQKERNVKRKKNVHGATRGSIK